MFNNSNENKIIISQSEISVLKKLIMYIKFSCEETDSIQYASSDVINGFFDKLIELDYIGKHEKEFYNLKNLRNEGFIMKKILKKQDESINKIDDDLMKEIFDSCLYPFNKN